MTEITGPLDYKATQQWAIIAKKKGSSRDLRALTLMFGFAPSADEALSRVLKTWREDDMFRQRWKGWLFAPVLANYLVEIDEHGAMLMHRNDKEKLHA